MVHSNTIPSAATRPSLPEMDSSPSVKGRMNVADLQPRTKQFSDINQKLSLQKQVSLNTASEAAKNRRSITTGMLRNQAAG